MSSVYKKSLVMAVVIGLGMVAAVPPAFAQIEVIVSTLEDSYVSGESIVISGRVSAILEDTPVNLKIELNRELIEIAQLTVSQDKSFTHIVIANGTKWERDGKYEVIATYGIADSSRTNFEFTAAGQEISDTISVDDGDSGTFLIKYIGTGVTVEEARIEQNDFALVATVASERGGTIVLELPRNAIDAKTNGCEGGDEDFIVLVDGAQVAYDMAGGDSNERSVGIDVDGDAEVQVIGTCVIPEFGALAALMFAAAITAVIILRGTKTRILP